MHREIQVRALQTYGYHGLFEEERRLGQKFCFDIEATLKATAIPGADDLSASIRYDQMIEEAVKLGNEKTYKTLEALAEAMAVGLLAHFPLIEEIVVGVSKFSPPIAYPLEKAGVKVRILRCELHPPALSP